MSDLSPLLSLPYLAPAQAQKHVTHNEALQRLDVLVQLTVQAFDATSPPAVPSEGAVYALGAGALSQWAGQSEGDLAAFQSGAWQFYAPRDGWSATDASTGELRIWTGGVWRAPSQSVESVTQLGISATADATNRLAVASEASLFTHAGAGHQIKLNKANSGETGSVLFQTGFSGRAEMGLAGNDDWSIKVSADGASWVTALELASDTGLATGTAVQSAPDDVTPGRLMRADFGYGPANVVGPVSVAAGAPTGAVIERGSNANGDYVRFADGTQICWIETLVDETLAPDAYIEQLWSYPIPFLSGTVPNPSVGVRSTNTLSDRRAAAQYLSPLGAGNGSVSGYVGVHNRHTASLQARLTAQIIGRWF